MHSNMADKITTRGAKSAVSYAFLHNLSAINIFVNKRRRKQISSTKFYEAENIERRKKHDMVSGFDLVYWHFYHFIKLTK